MKLVIYYDTHAYYFITDDVALYIERRRSNTFLFRIVAGTIGSSRSVGIMGEYTYRKDLIKKKNMLTKVFEEILKQQYSAIIRFVFN